MDQSACKELEETGTVQQNKTDGEEGRTEGWQMEMKEGKRKEGMGQNGEKRVRGVMAL